MRGLTPGELGALTRLLKSPPRDAFDSGSSLDELYLQLLEQGRVIYTLYPEEHENLGFYSLTHAGREALRLWPAVREALGAA